MFFKRAAAVLFQRTGSNFNGSFLAFFLSSAITIVFMKNLFYASFALVVLASCGHGSANNDSNEIVTPPPAAAQVPAGSSNAVALNPKHGQPGHRCDIPEGAPLNTAAANPAIGQPSMNASPVVGQPVNPAGSTVRLNPPHGQPGHDCAVEVGKPLTN